MGGVYTSRVPLDKQPLRSGDGNLLACLRHRDALCRTCRRPSGYQEGILMEYRHLVCGRLPACHLRRGDGVGRRPSGCGGHACRRGQRRADLAHSRRIAHALHPCAMRAGDRRGGQLPRCEQGHGRVLPQEGPCLCHEYLQRGIYRRGSGCAVPYPDAGGALRMGGFVHHHRSAGLRMDGFLAVPLQETRPQSRSQCRRAGVYKFRLGARKARLGVGARPEGVAVALLRIPSDVGLHLG